MKQYDHIAATVLITEDVSEVVLFGGTRDRRIISETTIIRLGKLCSIVRWLKGKKSQKCDMADKSTKFCIGVCFGVKNEKIIGSSDN